MRDYNQLGHEFFKWIESRIRSGGDFEKVDFVGKGKFYFNKEGGTYFAGFGLPEKGRGSEFFLHSQYLNEEHVDLVERTLKYVYGGDVGIKPGEIKDEQISPLTMNQEFEFNSIYDSPEVGICEFGYNDGEKRGVIVKAKTFRIPVGKKGGLSELLFTSAEAGILVPVHRLSLLYR